MPGWAAALGVDLTFKGIDLPIGAPVAAYATVVDRIQKDPTILGMVVTTHKAALWSACESSFARVTALAAMLREVGGVSRASGVLTADAPDVRSVGRAAQRLLTDERWTTGARHALILGAGGAGLSLAYNLSDRLPEIAAERVVLTDVDPARVTTVRAIVAGWERAGAVTVELATPGVNDRLVSQAPPGSLMVNASGAGKDRPGSPLAPAVRLPRRSIYWDFNYRGELPLLAHARSQAALDDLLVVDGRDYLVCGWMEALCFVVGRQPTDELLVRFDLAAQAARV